MEDELARVILGGPIPASFESGQGTVKSALYCAQENLRSTLTAMLQVRLIVSVAPSTKITRALAQEPLNKSCKETMEIMIRRMMRMDVLLWQSKAAFGLMGVYIGSDDPLSRGSWAGYIETIGTWSTFLQLLAPKQYTSATQKDVLKYFRCAAHVPSRKYFS